MVKALSQMTRTVKVNQNSEVTDTEKLCRVKGNCRVCTTLMWVTQLTYLLLKYKLSVNVNSIRNKKFCKINIFLQWFLFASFLSLRHTLMLQLSYQYHQLFNENFMATTWYLKYIFHLSVQTMFHVILPEVFNVAFKSPRTRQGNGFSLDCWSLEVPNGDIKRSEWAMLAIPCSAERAVVSSCWEEVTLPLTVRDTERATSG